MRLGVLADVHGNLPALEAVLAALEPFGVDRYVVAGDLVGYGPHPNECVERVAALEAVSVAGNHDLIVLGELTDERCIPLAKRSIEWTKSVLRDDARTFLASLPLRACLDDVHVTHGTLDDPQEYMRAERVPGQLERIEADSGSSAVLVFGHTHRPFAFALRQGHLRAAGTLELPSGPVALNPGAVGQARELRAYARAVVLDVDARRARFFALRYDVHACRRALSLAGLPPSSCHVRPSPVRRLARAARAARRRLTHARPTGRA